MISGNTSVGVEIYGSGSTSNLVEGNIIGLAADGHGTFRATNGLFIQSVGVFIQAASNNEIGGAGAGAGNLISGNASAGVFILSKAGTAQGNRVQGNLIGLGENGSAGPGNDGYGIVLDNAPRNQLALRGSAANQFGRNGIADVAQIFGAAARYGCAGRPRCERKPARQLIMCDANTVHFTRGDGPNKWSASHSPTGCRRPISCPQPAVSAESEVALARRRSS